MTRQRQSNKGKIPIRKWTKKSNKRRNGDSPLTKEGNRSTNGPYARTVTQMDPESLEQHVANQQLEAEALRNNRRQAPLRKANWNVKGCSQFVAPRQNTDMSSAHLTASERTRRLMELQAYKEPDTFEEEPPAPAQCELAGCTQLCWVELSGRIHDYCSKTHARAAGALPPPDQSRTVTSASAAEHADLVPQKSELYPLSKN